jgi:hypothetical protein
MHLNILWKSYVLANTVRLEAARPRRSDPFTQTIDTLCTDKINPAYAQPWNCVDAGQQSFLLEGLW